MNAVTARELDNAFDQYRTGYADALAKHGIAAFIIGDRRGVAKVTRRQKVRKNATTPNINYDAATAYIRKYRDDLINRGGTDVGDNKLKQMKFAPWLKDGSDEMRRQVTDIIDEGFKEGKASVKVTKDLREYFDETSIHDPEMVARTERARLEGEGERENYRQNDIELVEWLLGDNACEECIDVANTDVGFGAGIYPIDDAPPIPQHPGCLIKGTRFKPLGPIIAGLRSRYSGPVVELVFSSGTSVTVTPNHMLLTPSGFCAAQFLREGDDVVDSTNFEGATPSVSPDHNNTPTTVEEKFSSLSIVPGVFSHSVPSTSENFHGDGRFIDGNIDVILAKGFLRGTEKSPILKHLPTDNLDPCDRCEEPFLGFSKFAKRLIRWVRASDRIMGGLRSTSPIFWGRSSSVDSGLFAHGPYSDPVLNKALSDSHAIHAKMLSECLEGGSGEVLLNHITLIKVLPFHDYVYDFQTVSSLLICNGAIVSNCECDTAPVAGGSS